jgi:hypothetical protein
LPRFAKGTPLALVLLLGTLKAAHADGECTP